MNAVEIEEAVSDLAAAPFDPTEFPFAFLTAFGNKATTVKRLRGASSNASDVEGGVLQRNNIHIAVCPVGRTGETLTALRSSPKTAANKAKFILATDGVALQSEELCSGDGETIACDYAKFADHFGFFLPLAGISTVRAIKNNPIDIKATGRLNKLYVELLKDNPDWTAGARRADMNQFMARLIFCFFAEDTGIFLPHLFTKTIEQMSDSQAGNTHEVMAELFRTMDTKIADRKEAKLARWADAFPYVNGKLFAGATDCPRFSRIARSYLLRVGELEWKEIHPDIFGSMIQAVADDDERGALGMHYTSVPNILKVLNPLFLDDMRKQLEAAGDNVRKLRNLRKRLAAIRVFDPACGSGNFLVVAYIRMREIEHEIVQRTDDEPASWIKLSNFYGIEIKGFAAEIARLSLLIAEYQSDVRLIGQREAQLYVLPLKKTGHIVTGNALRLDWLEVCPPVKKKAAVEHDLVGPTGRLALHSDGLGSGSDSETYICGNPPYLGFTWQSASQKAELEQLFAHRTSAWKSLDYVAGWFIKATDYAVLAPSQSAFVSTNSICQGEQVPILWPHILGRGRQISFAYTSFKWTNLASHNAGVTVAVIGLAARGKSVRRLFETDDRGAAVEREVAHINAYLVPFSDVAVRPRSKPTGGRSEMPWGNKPTDGGNLSLSPSERSALISSQSDAARFVYRYYGSKEFIRGETRYCLWIRDADASEAMNFLSIADRVSAVATFRSASKAAETRPAAAYPHRFRQIQAVGKQVSIIVPGVSSESRGFLPVGVLGPRTIVSNLAFALYDSPLWNMALIASRIHLVWIATVCGKLKTDFRYSNTLGWNTFPVPTLTEKNKADLTACAEDILLAREAHFPATIADLYAPDAMPNDLRAAHEKNDETLERIYIGRRFKNDTERLEKLFEMYTKMTADQPATKTARKRKRADA